MTENMAPCGSATTAKRPMPGMSMGGFNILPPRLVALAAA